MESQTLASPGLEFACAESEVPSDGTVVTRTVNGRSVVIARRSPNEDVIVAFDTRCPHMQAPLRFGRVVDGEVVCPWHFFRFDTTTGQAVGCDKSIMKLKTYPVQIVDGKVYVQTVS
jgi:nitrite reductase (NADH) small subunit